MNKSRIKMISRLPKADPGLFDHKLITEQLIAGQLIEIGLMLLEQLIVELLGLAISDTGT
jgi:hypothetical protein